MSNRGLFETFTAVPLSYVVAVWVTEWPINPLLTAILCAPVGIIAALIYLALVDLVWRD